MPSSQPISKRAPEAPSPHRKYIVGGAAVLLIAALAWVWWPSETAGPTAPPQVEDRASQITEKLRQAEPQAAPVAPVAPAMPPAGGPKNLRQRPPQ